MSALLRLGSVCPAAQLDLRVSPWFSVPRWWPYFSLHCHLVICLSPPPRSACFSRIHKECGPDFKKDSFYGAEILVPFHVIFLFLDVKRKLSPRREQGVQLQVRELRSALGGGYLRGTLTAAQTMAERGAPHPQVLSLWVFF